MANVVTINGVDYDRELLSDKMQYLLAQMDDLFRQRNELSFAMDQKQVALDFFTGELDKEMNDSGNKQLLGAAEVVNN